MLPDFGSTLPVVRPATPAFPGRAAFCTGERQLCAGGLSVSSGAGRGRKEEIM